MIAEKTKLAGNFASKERFAGHWLQDWIIPSLFVLGKPSTKHPKLRTAEDMKCFASARAARTAYPVEQLQALLVAAARVAVSLWRLHVPDMRPTEDDLVPTEGSKGASVPSWANIPKSEVCCCISLCNCGAC